MKNYKCQFIKLTRQNYSFFLEFVIILLKKNIQEKRLEKNENLPLIFPTAKGNKNVERQEKEEALKFVIS